MLNNKKGLVNSLVIIMIVLFIFALASALALKIWNSFNSEIQGMDEDIVGNASKQQIDGLTSYILWGDKLFTFVIVTLLVGFIITSFTSPADNPYILIIYFGVLLLITFIAMFLSNTWTVFINNPELVSTIPNMKFTDLIMRGFPYIVFFTGVIGGLIFYMRARGGGEAVSIGGGEQF